MGQQWNTCLHRTSGQLLALHSITLKPSDWASLVTERLIEMYQMSSQVVLI